jgi:hypothetical protein
MTKIDQPIVAFSIVTAPPTDVASKTSGLGADTPDMPPTRQRPETLSGATYKVKTPLSDHALYITINDQDGRPFEMFINCKDMAHFQWIVALTRVISAVLRHGGEVNFLIEELKSVFDPKGGYFKKGRYMPSLVAEIGEALEQHLTSLGLFQRDNSLAEAATAMVAEKTEKSDFPPNAELCLYCNTKAAILMDGCLTCVNCGVSKCG